MNLTLFRQLYESTFKAEPLLAGFWSVAMYDLEEESFSSWATMREKLRGLLAELPAGEATHLLASIME